MLWFLTLPEAVDRERDVRRITGLRAKRANACVDLPGVEGPGPRDEVGRFPLVAGAVLADLSTAPPAALDQEALEVDQRLGIAGLPPSLADLPGETDQTAAQLRAW